MIKKLINKYYQLPVQIKASFWFLICAFLQRGISVITTPIFTRLLSTTEYGKYSVYNSWLGIVTVVVSLNLYAGVFAQGVVKFEDDKKKFASTLQGLCLTLDIFWTIVYLIFHAYINKVLGFTSVQMLSMFVMIWTTAAFNFWSVEQRVDFKYKKLVIISILTSIAKPLIGIFLVIHANDKVTARILGLALVEFVAYVGLFCSQMYRGRTFFSAKYWEYALVFNIPLIPHYLSQTVLNSADRIMIEKMVGSSEAGIYSLAYSISLLMTLFNTALNQTLEPWIYKKIKEKKIMDISVVAYPAFTCIGIINIILIAFAPELVRIFAPSEYYEAIYVIPPVAMSVYFQFMYTFFASFEFYFEKTKYVSIATMIGAILNICLNYIFIQLFGYISAGYTTLICYILYAVVHYMFMNKICKNDLNGEKPYSVKKLLSITGTFMTIAFLILSSYNCFWLRYILICTILVMIFLFRKKILLMLEEVLHK